MRFIVLFLCDVFNYLASKLGYRKTKEVWIFNSGAEFSGNVKHLFLYVNENRKDIVTCYLPNGKQPLNIIRKLGFRAYEINSRLGRFYSKMATVFVTEQFKESYPRHLRKDVKLLNLWHGVGLKSIERHCLNQNVANSISKKYVRYNELFTNNTLFLVSSPFMEEHFKYYCNLSDDQIVRAGYPKNHKEHAAKTFDINLFERFASKKPSKVILYAPTFREGNNFLYQAFPDINALLSVLKQENALLIIKLHPRISNDFLFNNLKQIAKNEKNILLWDNSLDIYEIFDKVDVAIVDYSSIFYDLLEAGVKQFIRYVFDYENNKEYLVYDYFDNTCGTVCLNFNELINALQNHDQQDQEKMHELRDKFWSYSTSGNCSKIVEAALSHNVKSDNLPTFYSFDIFDTLIARKVVEPKAIFLYVQDKLNSSSLEFPLDFSVNYLEIRAQAEQNAREEMRKKIGNFEITFDGIFDKLSNTYDLSKEQVDLLKKWEIEAELENVIAVPDNVEKCENLIKEQERVVLISDMYLPKDVIRQMVQKVSPLIAELPMYVSYESGHQKVTTRLYTHVFQDHAPWFYKEWHHFGDNRISDGTQAKKLGIKTTIHGILRFNQFERALVQKAKSYDGYLLAGLIARYRQSHKLSPREYFAFAHVSGYFYHYLSWVISNAIDSGIKTLYFISRDGYILKRIADKIIELDNLQIKTKYIYGSRKAWRVPSQIDTIETEFFGNFGNVTGIQTYSELLDSLKLSHDEFVQLFPELTTKYNSSSKVSDIEQLRLYLSKSIAYRSHLLNIAKEERVLVNKYLLQEIDFSEKFAFVEYWGRGYTQTCLAKLLENCNNKHQETTFYYYRSIYKSEGRYVRKNYSTNNSSLIFIEAVFANNPYQSVGRYVEDQNCVKPDLIPQWYDEKLLEDIFEHTLNFAELFCKLPTSMPKYMIGKIHSNMVLDWSKLKPRDPALVDSIAHLKYSESIHGEIKEFAPEINMKMFYHILRKAKLGKYTKSLPMSYQRSSRIIKLLLARKMRRF